MNLCGMSSKNYWLYSVMDLICKPLLISQMKYGQMNQLNEMKTMHPSEQDVDPSEQDVEDADSESRTTSLSLSRCLGPCLKLEKAVRKRKFFSSS